MLLHKAGLLLLHVLGNVFAANAFSIVCNFYDLTMTRQLPSAHKLSRKMVPMFHWCSMSNVPVSLTSLLVYRPPAMTGTCSTAEQYVSVGQID